MGGIAGAVAGVSAAVLAAVLLRAPAQPAAGRDTTDVQAYTAFAEGQALYNARHYRGAAGALERAVARDPAYGSGWALLAKTYGRLAQWVWAGGPSALARATAVSARAAQLSPRSADTRVALALAARAQGDVVTWRREAQTAIALDPLDAEAYALLADWYSANLYGCDRREQNPALADAYYRKALDLKPDLTIAVENLASNLRARGRVDECIALLDDAIARLSDETPLLLVRGRCLLAKGDPGAAARDIEPLRNNPKIAPLGALAGLGWLELARGDAADGTRDLEAAARTNLGVQSELNVAEVYARVSDTAHTAAHLRRAFAMDRRCPAVVATSLQFRSIRDTRDVKALLAAHGIR